MATGAKRRLTSPPEFVADDAPRFSPDGKTISFVRSSGMITQEIFVVPAAGGAARQLTFDKSNIRGAAWSADGRHLVFVSRRANNQPNLWRVAATGGEPELIAAGGKNVTYPAVSPDGRTIAFVEESNDANIWRLKKDEGKRMKDEKKTVENDLTHPSSFIPHPFIQSSRADHSPHLSPDDSRVAFVSDRTGKDEIWIADADGKNQRQLTDSPDQVGSPRFSPDGKWVAYDAFGDGGGDIFIVSADGGAPRRLTDNDSRDVLPAWSADGKSIYFTSNRGGSLNLWKTAAAGGGEAVQMTEQGAFESFAAPGGGEIYFTKARGVSDIWKIPEGGGAETPVAELAEAGYWRYWTATRDGIYYVARSSNAPYKIMFFAFADKKSKEISSTDKPPIWIYSGLSVSADGETIFYARQDQIASSIMLAEIGK